MSNSSNSQSVKVPVNKSFQHKLGHRHTTTLDYFRLQPVLCSPMIPGDKFAVSMQTLIQSAPLATQVFGSVHCDFHAFFVPYRILWNEWDNYFLGDGRDITTRYSYPYIENSVFNDVFGTDLSSVPDVDQRNIFKEKRRVFGSLGYPVNTIVPVNFGLSALQARAFQRIWWDYYRDSVNIPEVNKDGYLETDGGVENGGETFEVRYRTFKKDYITTLLESPQMGSSSSVTSEVSWNSLPTSNTDTKYYLLGNGDGTFSNGEVYNGVAANASISSSFSIPLLRGAVAMQRYLERINVTGTRPMERLLSLLGVKASAERLDMAEFIGEHRMAVNIDGLVNTGSNTISDGGIGSATNAWNIGYGATENGAQAYQGYQTGYGHGRGQSDVFHYSAHEHGFFMVIASLVPEYSNPNAMNRQFIRGISTPDADRFDFFTPDMDGVGYQEMLLSEVCMPISADASTNAWDSFDPFQVVGYQPKYEDYRIEQDRISGDFNEEENANGLRNLVFVRSFQQLYNPDRVTAGLNLTTATFADRALFDNHFQITDPSLDHFVLSIKFKNDAIRPVASNELPTELSDMANSTLIDVSNGGVRI